MKKIYCIENIVTNKKYIGFSSNMNLKMRLAQHACGKAGLAKFIQREGRENFIIYMLEETLDKDREAYWIERMGTIFPNGYNFKSGGVKEVFLNTSTRDPLQMSRANRKKVIDQDGNIYPSLKDFCKANNVNNDNIHRGKTPSGYRYKGFTLELLQ